MSGIFKAIGKVFNAVVSVVKAIWKPVLIAAAVYFTAGLALSAFPATASFAAAMPGFAGSGILGTGIGAGSVAGTGVFTHLASTLGMATLGSSGGLVGGALASGTSASALAAAGVSGSAITAGSTAAVASGAIPAAALPAEGIGATTIAAGTGAAVPVAAAGAGGGVAAAAAGAGKMTLAEKFLVASTVSNVASGLTAPSQRDIAEAQKKWVGAFYGVDAAGKGAQVSGPPTSAAPRQSQQLIPIQGMPTSATGQPTGQGPVQPGQIPGTTIKGKAVPPKVQQARQAMTAQNGAAAATAQKPFEYGKGSLIPTTDAPFESLSPGGSTGQLDALA